MDINNSGKTSQVGELKEFISQRLNAATSEILGAVVRTLSNFEEETTRLKEENQSLRSLLKIIAKSREGAREPKIIRRPDPTRRSPPRHQPAVLQRGDQRHSLKQKSKCLFSSREDLLKVQDENENCPYCVKSCEATEIHLLNRHYARAIHLITDGTEKFVIPCMCKDIIQGRSHWHCPICSKIIHRTCNFEAHLSKLHGCVTQQRSSNDETNQPSASVFEAAPPNNEAESQQQLEQLGLQMLQIKQETDEVTHPEVSGEPVQNGETQRGGQGLVFIYGQEPTDSIMYTDSFIQDIGEIASVHNYTRCFQIAPPSQPMLTDAEREAPEHEKSQHGPRKRAVTENVSGSQTEGSTQLSPSPDPTGPRSCKACGKVFPDTYTLQAHVQTHTTVKKHTCGICGKRLKPAESLARHLKSHSKTNKCFRCNKHFSCSSRLKRHMKFHRTKVLNAPGRDLEV